MPQGARISEVLALADTAYVDLCGEPA